MFLREIVNHANIAKHNRNCLKIGKIVHFYHSYYISKHQIKNCKIHVIILWKPLNKEGILRCFYVRQWIRQNLQNTIEIVWQLTKYISFTVIKQVVSLSFRPFGLCFAMLAWFTISRKNKLKFLLFWMVLREKWHKFFNFKFDTLKYDNCDRNEQFCQFSDNFDCVLQC